MAYLAKLARADAIAVILNLKGEGYATYVAHNLPTETKWSQGMPAAMLAKAMSERSTEQATSGVALPLSDGRLADTLAVSPVIWKDQVVGGLAAMLAGRAFSAEDLASLGRVGDLIGLELAEANALWRAQRQGQDAEAKLKASRDLQAIIRKERDPDQLLEHATAQLADVFGADGVSIMLADAHGELSVRSSRGLSDVAKLDRKRIGEGISGTVAQTGRSMLLSGQVQGGSDPTASESMIAPLRSNGRTLGVVSVKHRAQQERYGQMQVDSLTQAAAEIASALVTAEEFQRAEEDRRQALVLYELSRFATLGIDPHNDLESAVAMLADNLRHDAVGVWAAEEHHLHLRAATGYGDITPADISTSGTDTVLAQVLRERRTATAQYGMAEDRPDWAAPSSTHFLLAPIGGSQTGVVLGVLVLGRATTPCTSAEADFVSTLGEYLSGMLQKSASTDLVQRTASNERRRISQELHDGVAQELTGVVLALEGCQRALDRDPAALGPQLAKAARDVWADSSSSAASPAEARSSARPSPTGSPSTAPRPAGPTPSRTPISAARSRISSGPKRQASSEGSSGDERDSEDPRPHRRRSRPRPQRPAVNTRDRARDRGRRRGRRRTRGARRGAGASARRDPHGHKDGRLGRGHGHAARAQLRTVVARDRPHELRRGRAGVQLDSRGRVGIPPEGGHRQPAHQRDPHRGRRFLTHLPVGRQARAR